ncbi:MAG: polyhydroxyalkanoate depolymerase, partial [Pseudomonadota bacterium]
MLYSWYELGHAAVKPARAACQSAKMFFDNPFNPWSTTMVGRGTSAACEVFERTTRRYPKPDFGIPETIVDGKTVAVEEEMVWSRPFCSLKHFKRHAPASVTGTDPAILLVAPMSGHYATLLRGTVQSLLPDHDVYITDWVDARDVPITAGQFSLDTYIDYVKEMLAYFDGDVNVAAVCQPAVPVIAAIARMEAEGSQHLPESLIMMGGPIDTRINPTVVNLLAEKRGTEWFKRNVVTTVPWPYAGYGRRVYPGFLQLTGFMTMNLDRHINAHKDLFMNLVKGDGDSADKHREFYDEYLAVMDLSGEFYLDTVDAVFVEHLLPKGELKHRGEPVDLGAIRNVRIMTIEGERDDITGKGQCAATLDLCTNLPADMKTHYEQPEVGHYGIFNGSRFRKEILPRIAKFMRERERRDVRPPRPDERAVRDR